MVKSYALRSFYFFVPCIVVFILINIFHFYERGWPHALLIWIVFWPSFAISFFSGAIAVLSFLKGKERKNYKFIFLTIPVISIFFYFFYKAVLVSSK